MTDQISNHNSQDCYSNWLLNVFWTVLNDEKKLNTAYNFVKFYFISKTARRLITPPSMSVDFSGCIIFSYWYTATGLFLFPSQINFFIYFWYIRLTLESEYVTNIHYPAICYLNIFYYLILVNFMSLFTLVCTVCWVLVKLV